MLRACFEIVRGHDERQNTCRLKKSSFLPSKGNNEHNCLFFLKIAIFAQKITQKQPKNKPKITCTSPKPNILYSPPVEVYRIYVWAKFALICFAIFQVITFSLNY